MRGRRSPEAGVALTAVIISIVLVSLVAASALSLGYHQRVLTKKAVSSRTKAYYFAQAGLVDAREIIRKDAGGNFATPSYNPAPYTLDVDGDGDADVTIDIGAVNGTTGYRTVEATGHD